MNQSTQQDMAIELVHPSFDQTNPHNVPNGSHEPSTEELEAQLPVVDDGQVHLGDLVSRVVQTIFAELSELAETMPNMSDSARKRILADWVVKTKKQVVKLYAVAKWARDADAVQKCMNITAFLMTQNQQFEDALRGLKYAKDSLDPARLRNHDLLTSLDVLTTGSYLRLPSCIKKSIIPVTPLADDDIRQTLSDMEDALRYRLRLTEIIPVEMLSHRIANGRVYFHVPGLFETSICLRGARQDDGWFFVHVEFLINVGGDVTGSQEFPRVPTGIMKRHLTNEADARLAMYLPETGLPEEMQSTRPQLPAGVVDAPLIRLYNFLQMMTLSYQLEILWYQAERMRSLGWAEYLSVRMGPNRKNLTVSYWIRQAPPMVSGRSRLKLPLLGGTLTISIAEASKTRPPSRRLPGNLHSSKADAMSRIQRKAKLGNAKLSDEIENLTFEIKWEPTKGAFGVIIPTEDCTIPEGYLTINSDNLDFQALLRKILEKHAGAVLATFKRQLQHGPAQSIFSQPGMVQRSLEGGQQALRVLLCSDEVVLITIDARTGRLSLRDTGDLGAAGRGPRFAAISEKINENPAILLEALIRLRLRTITELIEQKADYLGLRNFPLRNFANEERLKLGANSRATVYIQLANFPMHYLVVVIFDDKFRYALITTKVLSDTLFANLIMEDIAWLNYDHIHRNDTSIVPKLGTTPTAKPPPRENEETADTSGFKISTQILRELYSYCCARVAYINVERQFKLRGIPFTHVNPPTNASPELAYLQSSLAHCVPALCVQSKDILSGAPAAEAAMPNIRVIPLNWWSEKSAQVVTCVKLKYVQQPMGKTAGTSSVIRPSKRIIYDTTEAVVSFLSENVNTCVDEFLEEWARVSKMVVIAREIAKMTKEKQWNDVRLLSFDLQTVEFAYSQDYSVSITCEDQLSLTGGNFDLRFSRCRSWPPTVGPKSDEPNPHGDAEPFLRNVLRHGHGRLAPSLHRLVVLLRDTLPIVAQLEAIRKQSEERNQIVDAFAKAAGWYRLLYSDLRHALDFRLLRDHRIAILDASHSLFAIKSPTELGQSNGTPSKPQQHLQSQSPLQAIPNFKEIVNDVVKDALQNCTVTPGKIAVIDVGIVCDAAAVNVFSQALHSKILEQLGK